VNEVLQGYLEAVRRNDADQVVFWRGVLVERMVMVNDAVKHHQRASRADANES